MNRPLLIALALCSLLAACHRQKKPSADFEAANAAFSQLYAAKLDDAFLDPSIDAIDAQLQKVPTDSLDAPNAEALRTRIREGKAKMQAELAAREKATAQAMAPPAPGTFAETPPAPAPAAEADAGTTGPAHPVKGMPLTELVARFGDCFSRGNPLEISGRGPRETFELVDTPACKQAHPGQVGEVVVIEDGKILGFAAVNQIRTREDDGGTSPRPPTSSPADAGR